MSQVMVAVCNKCKIAKKIGNFTFRTINEEVAVEFFALHKGHPLKIIGDEGGWEVKLDELFKKGYRIKLW